MSCVALDICLTVCFAERIVGLTEVIAVILVFRSGVLD